MEELILEEEIGEVIEADKKGTISRVLGYLKKTNPEIYVLVGVLLVIQYLVYLEAYTTIILGLLIGSGFAAYKVECAKHKAEVDALKDKNRETDFELYKVKYELQDLQNKQ